MKPATPLPVEPKHTAGFTVSTPMTDAVSTSSETASKTAASTTVLPFRASEEALRSWLPPLSSDTNKYRRGQLIVVAGSSAYPGAAALASMAAQRTGAGYTQLYGSAEAVQAIHALRPSVVALPWDRLSVADLTPSKPTHPKAILVGCGLDGANADDYARALKVITQAPLALVVDGGALTALASPQGIAAAHRRHDQGLDLIVTPHEGEAQRLIRGLSAVMPAEAEALESLVNDPARRALGLARAYKATVVLKGPNTYIAQAETVYEMDEGSAALAKAGTGDVLAGIIGALLVSGAPPLAAGVLGTTLHARAGLAAAAQHGVRSIVPEDVIDAIGAVLSALDAPSA